MEKYNIKKDSYRYVLAFDLAKVTGWALVDMVDKRIVRQGVINVKGDEWLRDLYVEFNKVFIEAFDEVWSGECLVTKERLPNQCGGRSTVATLQSLAQTHAVFDLTCQLAGVKVYDFDGVHTTSVKAYYKSLGCEFESGDSKQAIERMNEEMFGCGELDLNVSDAVGVAVTLVGKKIEQDVKERVRELKKEMKSAGRRKAERLSEEIERLISG